MAEICINFVTTQKSSVKANAIDKKAISPNTWRRVFKMNKPEWIFVFLGSVAAFTNGAMQPAWSIALAEAIEVGWRNGRVCGDNDLDFCFYRKFYSQ